MENQNLAAWGGAFTEEHKQEAYNFTASIVFDRRLYKYDIEGSCAHTEMLGRIGILTTEEVDAIVNGLGEIKERIEAGDFEWRTDLEDVHMNIESALTSLIGKTGEKLHTARSRNDQVSLDMRMWMRDQIDSTCYSIKRLQTVLIELSEKNIDVIIPGYTHLQRAQPVPVAHHFLAYVEMLYRDFQRFKDVRTRANVCPLGSGAVAATTLPLDREYVAKKLNFVDEEGMPLITRNSMDGVSDRDFIVEFLAACSITSMHLSQLCEELVIWCSSEFSFIRIGDAYCTGSSLMPQKKNPDIPEIIRGKTGRVYGNLISLLVTMKGLPLSYNYDMQEDKEALFDSADTIYNCLNILSDMLTSVTFNKSVCKQASSDPTLLATDLVDWLVLRNMPFRSAHHVVGRLITFCNQQNKKLNELTEEEIKSVHPMFDKSALDIFNLDRAMTARTIPGAPSINNVVEQLKFWWNRLESLN